MKKMVSVYGLADPNTGYIRYVGCSENPIRRFKQHLARTGPGAGIRKNAWIDSLGENQLPELVIFETVPFDEGKEAEGFWMQYLRMYDMPLTNKQRANGVTKRYGHDVVTRKITFSLEEESFVKLEALAHKRGTRMNNELRRIVESYLNRIKSVSQERAAS